jgi:hypothetical protein
MRTLQFPFCKFDQIRCGFYRDLDLFEFRNKLKINFASSGIKTYEVNKGKTTSEVNCLFSSTGIFYDRYLTIFVTTDGFLSYRVEIIKSVDFDFPFVKERFEIKSNPKISINDWNNELPEIIDLVKQC